MGNAHNLGSELYLANATGASRIADPGAGGTFNFKGITNGYVVLTATGTYTLPSAPTNTELLVCCDDTSVITLADAGGTFKVFTGTSGTTACKCFATDANSWAGTMVTQNAAGAMAAAQVSIADVGSYTSQTNLETVTQELLARTQPLVGTAITTVGNGTLTAAGICRGVIIRSGSTAAYTDATATGAEIQEANGDSGNLVSGWTLLIKNTVAFPETLSAGTGITLAGNTIVPPNSTGIFLVERTDSELYTITGLGSVPIVGSALSAVTTANNTDGTLTIPAATIASGFINRTGETTAFTDTTDTAANIIAAIPNASIGHGFELVYKNTLAFTGTLVGGTGVNSAGTIAVIPPLSTARFHVKYTSAGVVTFTLLSTVPIVQLPPWQFNTTSAASGLVAAGSVLAGAHEVFYQVTTDGAMAITTDTAANIFAAIPNCSIGFKYLLTIINRGDNTITLTGGTNVTIAENTIATLVAQTYAVELTSATAATWTKVRTQTTPT